VLRGALALTGVVPFKGVNYTGDHPAIVSRELFDKVQQVRATHNRAGDKRRIHHHPLKGTLFCHCGSRLGVTPHKGNGGVYDYAYCIGRHKRGTCQQPYVEIDRFAVHVADHYANLRIDSAWKERVRAAEQRRRHRCGKAQA
jgi:site-specific DNA recombinase